MDNLLKSQQGSAVRAPPSAENLCYPPPPPLIARLVISSASLCSSTHRQGPCYFQALAAEVVALEEKVLAARCRELRLGNELARARESHSHMQAQLESLTRDRGGLITQLHTLQVSTPCAQRFWGLGITHWKLSCRFAPIAGLCQGASTGGVFDSV